MTEDQAATTDALILGRLPFPFADELQRLRGTEGPLTETEAVRLAAIEDVKKAFDSHEDTFRKAVVSGDLEAANSAAEAALRLCEGASR